MIGLCHVCEFARTVKTKSGSTLYLCERHKDEPIYPKYPSLPVLHCFGFRVRKESAN
jgi:hypothetical protein